MYPKISLLISVSRRSESLRPSLLNIDRPPRNSSPEVGLSRQPRRIDERGFAGPGRADTGDEVAFVDLQGGAMDRGYFLASPAVDLGQVYRFQRNAVLIHALTSPLIASSGLIRPALQAG